VAHSIPPLVLTIDTAAIENAMRLARESIRRFVRRQLMAQRRELKRRIRADRGDTQRSHN
jgi:hypothetical protein